VSKTTTAPQDAASVDALNVEESGIARLKAQISPEGFAKFEESLNSAGAWGADNAAKTRRNKAIVAARAKGLSWKKIGEKHGISPERCRAIARRAAEQA
jgi:DNA-binding NarL/FixJ family response regulator